MAQAKAGKRKAAVGGRKRAASGARRPAAKKAPVKKAAAKKAPGRKAPAKKVPAKRAVATKAKRGATVPGKKASAVTPPIEKVFLPDDWNNTEKIILARRSTRAYQKRQVPEQMVRRVIECGRYAPSEGNCQPWRFIVVRDRAMLDEMEADAKKAISKMWSVINYRDARWKKPHTKLLEFLTPNNLHPIPSGAMRATAEGRFDIFWGAPTVLLILKDKRGIGNPDLDIGIVGTNMAIAAHSFGLGTCWIGVVSVLMFYEKWRKMFNIRHPWYLEQGFLMGFPVGDPDGFVHRDTHYIDWFDEDGHKVVS